MDSPGHALWSYVLFYWTGHPLLAALAGVLPDIISFGPDTFRNVLRGKLSLDGHYCMSKISRIMKAYRGALFPFTHSIFTAGVVSIAAGVAFGAWWMLAWPAHVCIDIFTHPRKQGTPFLYPFTDYRVHGPLSWTSKRFFAAHYALLLVGWITLIPR